MTIEELARENIHPLSAGIIPNIFGEQSSKSSFNFPSGEVNEFFNYWNKSIVIGISKNADLPILGESYEWDKQAHLRSIHSFLDDEKPKKAASDLLGISSDARDYFIPTYGCEGDFWQEEDFGDFDISGYYNLVYSFDLYEQIQNFLISSSWYEAAKEAGILHWSKSLMTKLENWYQAVLEA